MKILSRFNGEVIKDTGDADLRDLLAALNQAELALAGSYDACEWPADGTSEQEKALEVVRVAIAKAEGKQ